MFKKFDLLKGLVIIKVDRSLRKSILLCSIIEPFRQGNNPSSFPPKGSHLWGPFSFLCCAIIFKTMSKKSFSILTLVIIYLILILDKLALHYSLYWHLWWFDIVMHFLGGFWLAFAAYYIFYFSGYFKKMSKKFSFFTLSLTTVILIGVLWELLECVAKVSTIQSNYILDTYLDLFMDVTGWLVAYFILLKIDKLNKAKIAEKIETDIISSKY